MFDNQSGGDFFVLLLLLLFITLAILLSMETWLCLGVKMNKAGNCEIKIKIEVTLCDKTRP